MNSPFRTAAFASALLATVLVASTATPAASADHSYPPDGDHPLRIAHTFVAPVGTLLEWTVTRPISFLGSIVAPYKHIDHKAFSGCSRERPARSCTYVVK